MSETLSQDPDGLGVAYTTLAPSYPSTPATPSSTVQDAPPGANLPPFSTFSSDMDSNGTFSSVSDRLFSDTRLLDISNWDYYTETRLIERGENGLSIISSQPQYRPWESKPMDSSSAFAATTQANTFTDAFSPQNGAPKLPSFQSQFQAFSDTATTSEPTLTTLTNLTPVSPNSSSSPQSQTLTPLSSSFHTLSAVNPRGYPLVPAPIQAREVPSIQQQFLDERHIQLYSHPTANLTLNNTIHSASIFPTQNGAIIQNSQIISSPTVVTLLKSEPDIKLTTNLTSLHQANQGLKLQNVALHPTQFQNPMSALDSDAGLYNGIDKKINGTSSLMTSPTRNDFRKKERRKIRANSLESSAESDGNSNMDLGSENSGQVAAVSSTDGFKNHHGMAVNMEHEISGGSMDKQVKKKRKRCGECVGCQKKDNCGDCAPCRNDKSHQICKLRRCEKLTEKKSLYGEPYMRGESRRGRGKGRGGASYRGRKPNGPITSLSGVGIPPPSETNGGVASQQPPSRPSPQPPSGIAQPMPVQQQPMTPMPFYADPNRFPAPVWQADPSQVSGWQGQFIQQIPTTGQTIDTYQQYPNGIYQTTYQQPAFESNTFYTGAVQVLTPTNARPPSAPNQQPQMIPQRPNSNYAHTPSPGPIGQQAQQQSQQQQNQQQQSQQQQNSNRQYQEYNQFGSNASTDGSQSRPSSVNSVINQNPTTPNANYNQGGQQQNQTQQSQQQQQQTVYTTVSAANFSPGSNQQQTQFVNANSGNGQPGYPQVNASSPQVVSHNSSGYSGNEQFSGQQNQQQWQQDHQQMMWEQQQQQQQQVQENKMEQQNYQHQAEQQNNHAHYMVQQQKDHSTNNSPTKMQGDNMQRTFSQADKVNLNTRIKTMILNKQQNDAKMEQDVKNEQNNATGHFLWYSHHHHLNPLSVDGGPQKNSLPNRDKNSLVNISPNNTQMCAQNNFKQRNNVKKKNNELPLRMQRPLHHNHPNHNASIGNTETSFRIDQTQRALSGNSGIQMRNQHNLIPKTEPLDDLKYDTLEPKREFAVETTLNPNFRGKTEVKQEYPITSQIQPVGIKKEVTFQDGDNFNKREYANHISDIIAHQSAKLRVNSPGAPVYKARQEMNSKSPYNVIDHRSPYLNHHQTIYVNQQRSKQQFPTTGLPKSVSPGLLTPNTNFQAFNSSDKVSSTSIATSKVSRVIQQNNTPQSPSVSSVNSPRSVNNEQIPTSQQYEPNSASSFSGPIQNNNNKNSPLAISNDDHMPLNTLINNSPSSPTSPNATKYYPGCESRCSLPMRANNVAYQSHVRSSYPKAPSGERGMEDSNAGRTSPPPSLYSSNRQGFPPSQHLNASHIIDSNADSSDRNIIAPSREEQIIIGPNSTDSGIPTTPHHASSINNSDSNLQNERFGQLENRIHENSSFREETKSSPQNVLKQPFCSPSSSDQVKSRLTNKAEKSPPKVIGEEIPQCHCFPPDQSPPEPGTYYTHLGCANNLRTLRHNLECQTGLNGPAIRIEKVRYTGKEGKTAQGCPIVKWVHRRVNLEEKYLVIVKHRSGHFCQSAFIVICLVVWEGVSQTISNDLYSLLAQQLTKFGIPTKRRCATNDPRTCACQGINDDTCGASFTFGCSWSMYYNGCKFTRSKDVRKFRLSVKEEETQIEEKLQDLADHVSPIYNALAPQSFINQTKFENVASECRLGKKPGRPFSGVTACLDFCAHAHKDIHNMNDGCTVVVTLTKHQSLTKPNEEQLHVLPLYVPDDTDEFDSKENQELKVRTGEIEILNKYECQVRTFSEPAEKCRNRKDKKEGQRKRKSAPPQPSSPSVSSTSFQQSPKDPSPSYNSPEIQSGQVSSTVLDSPNRNISWRYDNLNSNNENSSGVHSNGNNYFNHLPQFSVFKTPYSYDHGAFSNHYNQDGYINNYSHSNNPYPTMNGFHHPTSNLFSHYLAKNTPPYTVSNPFDDLYLNNTPLPPIGLKTGNEAKSKSVEISYTDNSECFTDPAVGGVAIALTHGSILFECAKHELHATTALKIPDRSNPTRISLVFYQHRSLNKSQHGLDEYTLKQKSKLDSLQSDPVEFESSFESSSLNSSLENGSGEVAFRTATLPTNSMTTMFPMYPCMVTGPYQEHYGGTLSMPNK